MTQPVVTDGSAVALLLLVLCGAAPGVRGGSEDADDPVRDVCGAGPQGAQPFS